MIVGLGIDVVSLDKITSLWNNHRYRLRRDILSDDEWSRVNDAPTDPHPTNTGLSRLQAQRLGMMFAAKEATYKAVAGSTIMPFNWCNIEIADTDPLQVRLHSRLKKMASKRGATRLYGQCCVAGPICIAIIVGDTQ